MSTLSYAIWAKSAFICGAGPLLADSCRTLSGLRFKRNLALRIPNPESIGSPFEYVLHASKIFCVDLWVVTDQLKHQRERAGAVAAEQVLISF
jgi:hypothetical protein